MPRPDNKKAIERYLSHFLPQLAEVAAPLRLLTEQSALFTWQTQQEEAFQALKTVISNVQVLKFYDLNEEATRIRGHTSTKRPTCCIHFAFTD